MLLGYAHPSGGSLTKNLPALATLRKRQPKRRSQEDRLIFEILEFFSNIYDYEIPLKRRLAMVTEIIDRVPSLHLEYQLLFYLALARWSVRSKQYDFAQIPLSRYRSLSNTASQGRSEDILGFGKDLLKGRAYFLSYLGLERSLVPASDQRIVQLTNRKLKQWLNIARIGWHLVVPQQDPRKKLANVLGSAIKAVNARGVAIGGPQGKMLQAFVQSSVTVFGLDEELNKEFAALYKEAPVRATKKLSELVFAELNQEPEELFLSWEEQPFASGSVAHVYKAVDRNGIMLAIKVPRRDIGEIAHKDFANLKVWALPLLRRFSKAVGESYLDQAEQLFQNELDLSIEASNLKKFGEIFKDDPDITVPKIVPELCSRGMLTMEYVDGNSMGTFLAQASAEDKFTVARAMMRLFFRSAFVHNLFKADLYEANFRFNGGKLVVLDFGRVHQLEAHAFEDHLQALWQCIFDPQNVKLPIPISLKVVESQIYDVVRKFVLEHHQISQPIAIVPDMKSFVDYMIKNAVDYAPLVRNVETEYLRHYEAWLWFINLMIRLDVKVNWVAEFKGLFLRYLPSYRPGQLEDLSKDKLAVS